MISRVAENAFWLQRYVERASSLARLLLSWTSGQLDAGVEGAAQWTPVLTTTGELPRFTERFGADACADGVRVLEYLTWDRECPVSIASSVGSGRENARVIRETISREVWESINREWLWLDSDEARELYVHDPTGFYRRVRDAGHQFRGAALATMPHQEPMSFMSLGLYLECADQTARILDVTHYLGSDGTSKTESVIETVSWIQTLLACGGYEGYLKRGAGLRARPVAAFLLLDRTFPRSVRHCLTQAAAALTEIRDEDKTRATRTVAALAAVRELVDRREIDDVFDRGIHEEITRIVDGLADLGGALYPDFFAPDLRAPSPSP